MTIQRGHQVVSNDVWIDADPSGFYHTGLDCDDDLAILTAISLHTRRIINVTGLSICGGNAPLRHTWNDAHILWKYINGYDLTGGVTPLKGFGWRSMQVSVKLLQLYNYMFPDVHDSNDTTIAISKQLQRQKINKTTTAILALGPPTNIAKAIQHQEKTSGELSITNNSHHIYLMGGELTNNQLDLNFRSDRASARTVIEANIPKTIIPIQTCGQIAVTQEWIESLGCHKTDNENGNIASNKKQRLAVCAYLPKMKQQVQLMPKFVNRAVKQRMTPSPTNENDVQCTAAAWKISPNLDKGFIPWDIVALLAISHPEEFDNWRYHKVAYPYCKDTEPCDGVMQVIQDLGHDYFDGKKRNLSGMVRIPHEVGNGTKLLDIMLDLIKTAKVPSDTEEPCMKLGLLPDLIGFGIDMIIFLYCCSRVTPFRGTK